ncbi:hypothetical protein C8R45DRAFT_1180526 [Mycena sanguinolenta]|nr:hypothetical protein C8R45DRAFT_1180526 [Mycena sanguinolenta]
MFREPTAAMESKSWVRDIRYVFQVFDNAGATEHDRLRPLGYRSTDVFVICFSVDLPISPSLMSGRGGFPTYSIIVPEYHIDLRKPEFDALSVDPEVPRLMITTAEGKKLAREIKAAKYVECSAKTKEGVQDVFDPNSIVGTLAIISLAFYC